MEKQISIHNPHFSSKIPDPKGWLYSRIDKRFVTGQIEHWARIGKCAEENPDLTYNLIK
jgi:hypothetical protein